MAGLHLGASQIFDLEQGLYQRTRLPFNVWFPRYADFFLQDRIARILRYHVNEYPKMLLNAHI